MTILPFDTVIHLLQNRTSGQNGIFVIFFIMFLLGYFTYKQIGSNDTFGWRWLGVFLIVAMCLQSGDGKVAPLTFACIGLLAHFSYDVIYRGHLS